MPISFELQCREHALAAQAQHYRAGRARADAADLAQIRRARARAAARVGRLLLERGPLGDRRARRPPRTTASSPVCLQAEELCWGDAGLYLRMPTPASAARPSPPPARTSSRRRFLARLPRATGQPDLGRDGDHRAPGRLRRRRDPDHRASSTATDEWVLNGTKIFCTAGEGASTARGRLRRRLGDPRQERRPRRHQVLRRPGRHAGHEARRLEKKLGIRASDTATLRFEDCRVPQGQPARQRRGEEAGPEQDGDRRQGLQGRDGDLRRQPPDRRGDGRRASAARRSTS